MEGLAPATTRPVTPLAATPRRPADHGLAVTDAAPSPTFEAVWTAGPGRSVLAALQPRLLAGPRGSRFVYARQSHCGSPAGIPFDDCRHQTVVRDFLTTRFMKPIYRKRYYPRWRR
jgi:hypothetical protein